MTTRYLAYSSRTTTSALMQVHGEFEEASQMSRAAWARTMRKITMPLLAPAMINVFFWVAVHAMQELSMALMLYNPDTVVVSTMIWSMWQNGRTADAAVLGVLLILLSAILLLGGQLFAHLRRDSNQERDSANLATCGRSPCILSRTRRAQVIDGTQASRPNMMTG